MMHPKKWRETVNPFDLHYKNFILLEVIGYPHAGNDVFHVKGIFKKKQIEAYIKVARQVGANIDNEIDIINSINLKLAPTIIDYDKNEKYIVSVAKKGERLSNIVKDNFDFISLDYIYEYGKMLAKLHKIKGNFKDVLDRKFFHIPDKSFFKELDIEFVYDYLILNKPNLINKCFCHGDFHYANILWDKKHISAILDFELSGLGNKEFDIAWALILRPGQKFLNTEKEILLFKNGYLKEGICNWDYVIYYMVLIYSYFYKMNISDKSYQVYVLNFFINNCKI